MCGIAAAIGHVGPDLHDAVRRISDCQAHRGPDAEGWWASPGEPGCALAHRRLAIIDLSPGGVQPMADRETGAVIVFNGEIYNYRVLREELSRLGHGFRTASDTEVILRAYAQWGDACFARLRGMFALVLWDPRRRAAVLARDHTGIKPLYWTRAGPSDAGAIVVASEVRSLLSAGVAAPRLSPVALSSYLWNGFVVGPEAMIRGVSLLPAGTFAVVDAAAPAVEPTRYWSIPVRPGLGSDPGPVREALRETVAQHMIADVPIGVFLSGGVDSSAMAAAAQHACPGAVKTFTIAFDEGAYDESPYARRVAAALGTQHTELRLSQKSFVSGLDDAMAGIDQPTFDSINTYFVSRAVREAGLKVAIAGTGGDELFGGYRSFTELPRLRRASRAAAVAPGRLVRAAAHAAVRWKTGRAGDVPPQTRWGKLPDALGARGDLAELYQLAYALFTPDFLRRLLAGPGADGVRAGLPAGRYEQARAWARDLPELSAISAMEVSFYLGERLLRDTDAASMAVSLEVRVPFLDRVLIESVWSLNDRVRFETPGSKGLLRRIGLEGLDPTIFDRPKSGFVLPMDVWCRDRLRGPMDEVFANSALCQSVGLDARAVGSLWRAYQSGAPGMYWSRAWAIYVLLWWSKRYGATI